jgi:D-glycero-D-manno-heptose 1,7-bisphosphate phosphatase
MGIDKVRKAVFLDRDGVINKLVFNEENNEYEPPHNVKDLLLFDWTINSLKNFQSAGYLLFIVSNQPDYAKGKTTLDNLKEVHKFLHKLFEKNDINFTNYYYCYHHPDGIVPEYSIKCDCRKPNNKNVIKAIERYNIDENKSWFIGDRESDIICGNNSGLKTIYINNNNLKCNIADYNAQNLKEAEKIILKIKI